jgi:heat shock protein HslJ
MGTCGVEVIGATEKQRFDLAGRTSIPLAGTHWVLDPDSLGVPLPASSVVTADFSDTSMSGNTSCNLYQADYTVAENGQFTLGRILMTRRACDPGVMKVESAYIMKLADSTHVKATTSELLLLTGGRTQLRFTPAASAE